MMRRAFASSVLLLAVLLLLVTPGEAFAVRKLGLSSGSFHFDVGPSDTASGTIIAINDGDEPIKVMVYSADQVIDPKGGVSFIVPSRADLSSLDKPSAWVRISMPENSKSLGNIPYLELAPGQRVPVRFSAEMPPDVATGDHDVMLFFEMFGGQGSAANSASSQVAGRIGSRLQLRVKGQLVSGFDVAPFVVAPFILGDAVPYVFTVKSGGNIDQRVVARASLRDRNDETLSEQVPVNARLLFAQQNLEGTGTLYPSAEQLLGQYTVRLEVTPVDDAGQVVNGGVGKVVKERTVWVVPIWVIVLAAIVLVTLMGVILWALGRRSGRRADASARPDAASPAEDDVA
jgi:hypothetical protein